VLNHHRILLVSGSLRRRSTSSAVLRTARAVASDDLVTVLYEGLAALPHFNPDDDVVPLDAAVLALRAEIRAADAMLLSTPEYAGALPGSFKNMLDWSIGDGEVGSIYEKPVAWLNTSPRRAPDAHESLRKVLGYAHATVVEGACVEIPVTSALVGEDALIADASTRAAIAASLGALSAHLEQDR
jgi:NAD(P)H-dependent FMN reductase